VFVRQSLDPPLPAKYFRGTYKGLDAIVAVTGKDPVHGVDSVGTLAAGLTAQALLKMRKTDLILSVGSAGGFKRKGLKVGNVVFSSHVVNHDRRISPPHPDANYARYGASLADAVAVPKLLSLTKWHTGIVSTGNSVADSELDKKALQENGAMVKDMEAAAVAAVAKYHKTPFAAIKVVSDLLDGDDSDSFKDSFEGNLPKVAEILRDAVVTTLDFVTGKSVTQL